jgi:hypothetical protein
MFSPVSFAEAEESLAASIWDLSWIDGLKGKHKQVFDLGSIDWNERDMTAGDSPLRVPRNYLNAHKEVFNLESPAVNTIVAITYSAFPINASDAIWKKYSLGERWHIKDPITKTWAVRNVFSDPAQAYTDRLSTTDALTKRGTIFWQCNNALGGVVGVLAEEMKMKPEDVRADLIAGMMPGVRLVPAHTMALGLVQEKGFTYEKI